MTFPSLFSKSDTRTLDLRQLTSPPLADLTVKARMQAGGAEGKSYTSTFDGVRKIAAKEGVLGLYKGIAPKLTQSVATAALLFLAKEKIYAATRKALIKTVAATA